MLLIRLPAVSVLEPKAVAAFACGLLFGPAALSGTVATLTLGAWRRGWPLAQGISMALLYTLVGLVAYLCFRPPMGLRRDIGDLRS